MGTPGGSDIQQWDHVYDKPPLFMTKETETDHERQSLGYQRG